MDSSVPEVLTIPVRPAVAKFLARTFHLAPGQAFKLTKKNEIGRMLYHLLRNPQDDRGYAITEEGYPGRFPVTVSQHMGWLNGCRHLTDQAIHDFNRHVEDLIDTEFIKSVTMLSHLGIVFETKQVALKFKALYDLTEDDLTLDALIKSYYRYRKAEKVAHERRNHIPKCPAQLLQAAA